MSRTLHLAALSAGKLLMNAPCVLRGFALQDNVGTQLQGGTPASNVGAAGAAATVTVAGVAGQQVLVTSLDVSLSATIAAGSLVTIKDGATVVYSATLPQAAGNYPLALPANGILITAGNTMTASAAAPGAAGVASLNISTEMVLPEAQFELWDGTSNLGSLIGVFTIPIGQCLNESYPQQGPDVINGLYINVLSGTVRGAVWVDPEVSP